MPNTRQFLLASLSMAALAASQTAIAQETPVADDDTELRQETITVTAQFREQSVIDVPAALTAYEGEFLSDIGVNEFDELSAFVPGLVVQEQSVNNPGFVIRGITSDSGASNIEPRVSVFENGVSIARSRGSIVQLFDIERVEVLKGPQGTLFGRSAQIGAVHVITNKAEQEFNASLQLDAGNFQFFEANGHINVPIIEDKLAGRIAASYSFRDGFLENTESDEELNGTDTVAVRASLRYTPTDKVTFDLIGTYSNDSPPGTSFKSGVIPALGGDTNPNSPASLNTFGNFLGGAELGVDREIRGLTFISDWELGDAWRWVTTASHREFNSLEVFDPDGTAFDLFIFAEDAQGEQTSLDTRFNYDNGGKFRGFFGAGLFVEDGSQEVPLGLGLGEVGAFFGTIPVQTPPDENGVALFFGDPALTQLFLTGDPALLAAAGVPSGLFQLETFTNFSDTSSFDVFAEGEYDITDRLTFTAGVRFTLDDKETLFSSALLQPAFPGSAPVLVANSNGVISSDAQAGLDNTFTGFSWRAVLAYEINDNLNAYFNYSRGRRPQVIQDNFAAVGGQVVGQFDIIPEETVDSFEVGAKGSFFDGRLIADAAVYYYDYNNFQTTVQRDAGPGNPPQFVTVNGGGADSFGVEVGITAQPTDWMSIFATYGYNRGRFDDFDENGEPQEFAGNQFRLSPDHSFSVGTELEFDTDLGTFFVLPTYTWQSEVFFQDENDLPITVVDPATGNTVFTIPGVSQDAFGLLNLRAGVDIFNENVRLEMYAENLLDEEFIIDGGNTGGAFGIPTFIAGKPRFWGGRVTVRY